MLYLPIPFVMLKAFFSDGKYRYLLCILLGILLAVNIKELHYLGEVYGIVIFLMCKKNAHSKEMLIC